MRATSKTKWLITAALWVIGLAGWALLAFWGNTSVWTALRTLMVGIIVGGITFWVVSRIIQKART